LQSPAPLRHAFDVDLN